MDTVVEKWRRSRRGFPAEAIGAYLATIAPPLGLGSVPSKWIVGAGPDFIGSIAIRTLDQSEVLAPILDLPESTTGASTVETACAAANKFSRAFASTARIVP